MNTQMRCTLGAVLVLSACAGDTLGPDPKDFDGPGVAVALAALNLAGVGDVVWDVQVDNGGGAVVWQRRVTSSGYGDGAGSASYLGPCDADAAVAENTVKVWVVGVYAAAVADAGTFNSGSTADGGAVTGTAVAFQNPTTPTTPLTRVVTCRENADAFAQFDVALMRPAQQGFFDIAVNFGDIFCSAKFDCCADADLSGSCDAEGTEDIALLFQPGGGRGATMVLGLACTAGARVGVETELYLDDLVLDCTDPSVTDFTADVTIDPSGPPGNQCSSGEMSACTGVVTEALGVDADAYLYQVGVYRGLEQLTSGGVGARKAYWNIALGVKRPDIAACWLRTRATADDALGTPLIADGTITAGAVYPYLQWDVDLGDCAEEQLSFSDPTAMVRPAYTTTAGDAASFAYGFGPSMSAGAFCEPACANGGACVFGVCDCPAGFSGAGCETPAFSQAATLTSNFVFTVPAGVTLVRVKAWGAGGGGGATNGDVGGGGGFAQADLPVTPGEDLLVIVGGGGGRASNPVGGQNGGGAGSNVGLGPCAGGGGYSGVFRATVDQAGALLVAGAGGGAGHYNSGNGNRQKGGAGGGESGTAGGPNGPGQGGTQLAGGSGYNAGAALQGGNGVAGNGSNYAIAGGGAGWFGGGSGAAFGQQGGPSGGGGSSRVAPGLANPLNIAGQGYGDASPGAPANASDPDYSVTVGVGGNNNTNGGNGYVVIRY